RKALYRGGACGKRVELSQKRVRHHFSARRKIVSDTVSVRLQTQLPGHEHQEVRGLPDPDFERFALTVPGLSVDPEQYGLLRRIGARRGLQRRGHLARVERMDPAVVLPSRQQRRGITGTGPYIVIRRIGLQVLELIRV